MPLESLVLLLLPLLVSQVRLVLRVYQVLPLLLASLAQLLLPATLLHLLFLAMAFVGPQGSFALLHHEAYRTF